MPLEEVAALFGDEVEYLNSPPSQGVVPEYGVAGEDEEKDKVKFAHI
jgi:hypothetical protein